MLSWECDLYVPEIIQTLARSGEALGAIGMMQNLLPMARSLGLDTEELPNDEEMSAVSDFISGMDASLLVVGEDDETDWRVAGQLTDGWLHGDVEGRARVVGKVSKVVPLGRWKPYLTFPGMNLLPREERRRMERRAPAPDKEGRVPLRSGTHAGHSRDLPLTPRAQLPSPRAHLDGQEGQFHVVIR